MTKYRLYAIRRYLLPMDKERQSIQAIKQLYEPFDWEEETDEQNVAPAPPPAAAQEQNKRNSSTTENAELVNAADLWQRSPDGVLRLKDGFAFQRSPDGVFRVRPVEKPTRVAK